MADFGFVGPSYEAPSIYQDGQECINFRPEIDPLKPEGSRGVVALYPTPGLTSAIVFQNKQEVRGMRTVSGGDYMVAVVGPYVYVLTNELTPTMVGQLNTSTGRVGITDNGLNVYIVDGSYRYTWRISTPSSALFTGSISGTTLTVTAVSQGTIGINQSLFGLGVTNQTVITALGTGTGGVGTYTINQSQTVASTLMNSAAVASVLTASMSGFTMTVTASSGTLFPGQTIQGSTVSANTIITAQGNASVLSQTIATAGTGYAVNDNITVLGGVFGTTPATYTVTTIGAGGAVTGLVLTNAGSYTSQPTNDVSTSSNGSGTGLKLTLTFGTGSGTTGTYPISASQTVTSRTMYALNFTVFPITDGAFEGGNTVDTVDNFFVYNRPNSQQYAASSPLSPITPPLSFSSKDGSPDDLVSLIVVNREVFLLGEASSEVWINVGTFPFPFQRIPGTNTQHGIAAKFSMSRLGNSFAYVSRNNRGEAQIMMMNGYIPTRISTHAVEQTLLNKNVDDAIAWTYQQEGHECYVVSFPGLDLTWVYDLSTGMWHKWLWIDTTNTYHRHRGNCSALFQGKVYVGDYENGIIYLLDPSNFTDNGGEIRRLRRAPHLVTDLQRQYLEELQIQFQPGVGNQVDPGQIPQAMLRWSNDGGSTWSNEHWTSIGKVGQYNNRAIWRRLGWARDRVFEVVVTDPINAVIISSNLKASVGEN